MVSEITWRKIVKLISACECAYLYSDGTLYLLTRDKVRGVDVEIRTLIRGYTKPWKVRSYRDDSATTDERMARVIFYSRTDKGMLTLARPNGVEVYTGSASPKSKPFGVGSVGLRFRYNGHNIKLEYLSQGHNGDRFGAETWEHYLVSAEFTVQTGLTDEYGAERANEIFLAPPMDGDVLTNINKGV